LWHVFLALNKKPPKNFSFGGLAGIEDLQNLSFFVSPQTLRPQGFPWFALSKGPENSIETSPNLYKT
jgi:hypothetical protein